MPLTPQTDFLDETLPVEPTYIEVVMIPFILHYYYCPAYSIQPIQDVMGVNGTLIHPHSIGFNDIIMYIPVFPELVSHEMPLKALH